MHRVTCTHGSKLSSGKNDKAYVFECKKRVGGKKEAVLIQLFYLVFAQPPLFCVHLFGMIEVKIFILQHENSGELCLNKSY